MEYENQNNQKYLVFGIAGALILGGFIYFLSSGGAESEVAKVSENSEAVAETAVVAEESVKVDRFANMERVGFFAYNSAELNASAKNTLSAWAEKLTENTGTLLNIEGHCDERGTEAFNLKLGRSRANAVKSFLLSKGIDSTRLHTISFGESRPLSKGNSESSFSENRRFELKEVSTFAQN